MDYQIVWLGALPQHPQNISNHGNWGSKCKANICNLGNHCICRNAMYVCNKGNPGNMSTGVHKFSKNVGAASNF
jgi:hypothetical protein